MTSLNSSPSFTTMQCWSSGPFRWKLPFSSPTTRRAPGQIGHAGPNEAGCTVAPDNLRRDAARERITPGLRHACGVGNKKQDISSESSNGYTYARVKLNVVTTLVRVSRVFITGLRSENEPPAARPPHRRRGSGQVLRWPGPARRSRPMTRSALRSRHWRHRRPQPSPPPR